MGVITKKELVTLMSELAGSKIRDEFNLPDIQNMSGVELVEILTNEKLRVIKETATECNELVEQFMEDVEEWGDNEMIDLAQNLVASSISTGALRVNHIVEQLIYGE